MSVLVLKLGGSVLSDESSLIAAVHEIYRWRREGWQVLAVTSALAGRTDALLARASALSSQAESAARATLVAQGELESAALLTLYLERAGVPARCLVPRILASGPALDATPQRLEGDEIARAIAECGVVVCPGYVAHSATGERVLLGRGGSDLSALFLASELSASACRLIKDIDGLYERDPALPGPPPGRYQRATFADALATDGSILQHKAVRFAEKRELRFEVAALQRISATTVGSQETQFAPAIGARKALRVALLGHGTVGAGVAQLIQGDAQRAELMAVAVRDRTRHTLTVPVFEDAVTLAESDVDVVIELIGGCGVAARAVETALRGGKHVITANKELLAERGDELRRLARANRVQLLYSASVGGSLPLLESMRDVCELEAILNGTANHVLHGIEEGHSLPAAVAEAQELGYAEADPSRDLDGRDTAAKLSVLASRTGGVPLHADRIERAPLDAQSAAAGVRQIARLRRQGEQWQASLSLERPVADSPLLLARGAQNVAVLRRSNGSTQILLGSGAGRWPTAESVYADFLELWRASHPAHELSHAE